MERILIASALPYANGPLHLGHAIGAYIPADVYARFQRMKGKDVLFICGTDEHGTPIAVAAEREGVHPKQIVDKYHRLIKQTFERLGISFDHFSRTTIEQHYKLSQKFFLELLRGGWVEKRKVRRPYCSRCKRFLPDRYVVGKCPHCGSSEERGDQCESCGRQLEANELLKARCLLCGKEPETRETEHWFFKLSKLADQLRRWIEANKHWPPNARNFALGWLREGLEDRAITRDLDWGVPVPLEGAEGKVLYVWFEAPIGYISATLEWAGRNEKDWKPYWEEGCKIVHFIGKDNIPFHTVFWPAMLMAHGGYALPWQIASNEYLNLEGRKMSTSRGWVIWLHEFLDSFDVDALRYYLLKINPEHRDADFSLQDFAISVNNELIATYGNFVHRTLSLLRRRFGGVVPKPATFDEVDEELIGTIEQAPSQLEELLEGFRFSEATKWLISLAGKGNEYLQRREPWASSEAQAATTLYLSTNFVRSLAILSYPFLPSTAQRIWKMLNLPAEELDSKAWGDAPKLELEPGHRIAEDVKPLFERVDQKKLEEFRREHLQLLKSSSVQQCQGPQH